MAPKGKKGKKSGDDWDDGLGESADPIAQAEAEAKAADAAKDAEQDDMGGGGPRRGYGYVNTRGRRGRKF